VASADKEYLLCQAIYGPGCGKYSQENIEEIGRMAADENRPWLRLGRPKKR